MLETYLITGVSDGIGLETAGLAAASGGAVLMAARDASKPEAAASALVGAVRPEVDPARVARAVMSAVRGRRPSVIVGPVAGIVMGTVPIMPRGLDLAVMTLLFKGQRAAA